MIDKLIDKILELKNPTVVGLDPRLDFLPEFIIKEVQSQYIPTPSDASKAILLFNKAIIDAIYDIVPAVKPQIAFYEQFGVDGINAYVKTIQYAKQKGLIVISDIKRGDIDSTALAYAQAHLGEVAIFSDFARPYDSDFATINPYLGYDSIKPFIDVCKKEDKGLFILVKTSNKGSADIQNLKVDNGFVYEIVGKLVQDWGKNLIGKHGFSSIGAVVGATHPKELKSLRKLLPNTFFLVPGYGAQGGSAESIAPAFNSLAIGAIINSSRGIIAAHKEPAYSNMSFEAATRQAAIDMRCKLQEVLSYAK